MVFDAFFLAHCCGCSKGAQKVNIESYCLLLVPAVKRLQDCHSYTGLIVDDC